jgi:peptidoglycan/LPS O-acetylase OafA/YrhL
MGSGPAALALAERSPAAVSLGRSPGPGSATQRDTSLDLLRVVGILVIFLVHGRPPGWVVQAVGFAVVLLVLASGMSHRLLLERQGLRPTAFLWRRLSRLVLPVWLFLAVYAAGTWLVTRALGRPFPWSRDELLETAFLGDGFTMCGSSASTRSWLS